MKQLTIIAMALCLSVGAQAQDGNKLTPEQYKEITKKITDLDSAAAPDFANTIL